MEYTFDGVVSGQMPLDKFCKLLNGRKVVLTDDLEIGCPENYPKEDQDLFMSLLREGKMFLDEEDMISLKKGQQGILVCRTYFSLNTRKDSLDSCLILKDSQGHDVEIGIPIYSTKADFVERS